jgi:hypothetical protein
MVLSLDRPGQMPLVSSRLMRPLDRASESPAPREIQYGLYHQRCNNKYAYYYRLYSNISISNRHPLLNGILFSIITTLVGTSMS